MIATQHAPLRLPPEFRKNIGSTSTRGSVHRIMREGRLHTVCEEAHCPNIGECFANKTATFMILGDTCTRRCNFCQVKTGRPMGIDPLEPVHLVDAIQKMGLDYVVITSVDRDELRDLGANHWAQCIRTIRDKLPDVEIELLTPDFKGKEDLIQIVLDERPDVFGHNIETVERLYKALRPQSSWEKTSAVLDYVSSLSFPQRRESIKTKSGLMVGLGETDDEVSQTLIHLKNLGVDIVTIGQYLRPSLWHWPVDRYVADASYERWKQEGKKLGFDNVFAGPFVRSSYHAKEVSKGNGS